MKLLHKDIQAGQLKLQIDTLDDLWTIRNLIRAGDIVRATTWRSVEGAGDKIRAEKQEKKPMRLGVKVESVEWHDFDDHLRVLGTIVDGPQDLGRHHTHVFKDEPGTKLELNRQGTLTPWDLEAINDAVAATHRPRVILLAIDDHEAQFATLTSYGVQMLGTISAGGLGKRVDGAAKAKVAYYDEVIRTLTGLRTESTTPLLVVGPGWWREEFILQLKQKSPEHAKGVLSDGTAHGGRLGIHEALRRGMLEQVAKDHRVAKDTASVEEALARIAKGDNTVAYGPDAVRDATNVGAVETVLVTDDIVRSGKFDEILRNAEQARGHIHIVATGHDAGAQLARMGGLIALLRFGYP